MTTALFLFSPEVLHIPDGFLDNTVAIFCWVISLIILGLGVRKAQADYNEKLIPLAGVMAAFIFAAQMINFPVLGGTSGHLIGASLAFIVLGPWLGLMVMMAVVGLQALLFQDGGLVAMGANILVMGIVPGFIATGLYGLARNRTDLGGIRLAGFAAWMSVVAGALVTAILLGASGTVSLPLVLPIMVGVHMLIGVGEALITVAALTFLKRSRPVLLDDRSTSPGGRWLIYGLGIALLVVLLAPFASTRPDGLEWVAQQQGFIDRAVAAPLNLLPGYTIPGLGDSAVSIIIAGFVGVLLVILSAFLLGRIVQRYRQG